MHVFARAELVDQRQADTTIMLQMFWLQANHSYGRRRSIPLAWTVYFGTSVPTLLLVLSGHRWRIEHSFGITKLAFATWEPVQHHIRRRPGTRHFDVLFAHMTLSCDHCFHLRP